MTDVAETSIVPTSAPLRVMVASSVYGFEDSLKQICAILQSYGYDVLNSHIGTIATHPAKSNQEICLDAVRQCDAFLGIIRPFYGSGMVGSRSITHDEMRLAVQLLKPRWFLVHSRVTFARQLLRQYLKRKNGLPRKRPLKFRKTSVLDDLRVLEMYEDVVQSDTSIEKRKGHWAHEFYELPQALRYIETQFAETDRVRQIVNEMSKMP
jgi:hypothetical protein